MASMLLSFVSRPYSISRTVAGFGIPAALATAYQVSPFRSRAARIFAPIPRVAGRGRFGSGGKSCCARARILFSRSASAAVMRPLRVTPFADLLCHRSAPHGSGTW